MPFSSEYAGELYKLQVSQDETAGLTDEVPAEFFEEGDKNDDVSLSKTRDGVFPDAVTKKRVYKEKRPKRLDPKYAPFDPPPGYVWQESQDQDGAYVLVEVRKPLVRDPDFEAKPNTDLESQQPDSDAFDPLDMQKVDDLDPLYDVDPELLGSFRDLLEDVPEDGTKNATSRWKT